MGVWGYAPFESDTFGEAFDGIEADGVAATVLKKFGKKNEDGQNKWAAVGVVIVLYHAGMLRDPHNKIIDRALEICEELRDDPDYMESWDDPAQFTVALENTEEALREMRGRHAAPILLMSVKEFLKIPERVPGRGRGGPPQIVGHGQRRRRR